jgi:hypothetical protein
MKAETGMKAQDLGLFIFGVPETLRRLPEGWKYVASPEDFLRAFSPDGREWMVTERAVVHFKSATPEDVAKSLAADAAHSAGGVELGGGLELGEKFLDLETILWQ